MANIRLKSARELELMQHAGQIVADTLLLLRGHLKDGVVTREPRIGAAGDRVAGLGLAGSRGLVRDRPPGRTGRRRALVRMMPARNILEPTVILHGIDAAPQEARRLAEEKNS